MSAKGSAAVRRAADIRTPEDAARLVTLYDAPGYLEVQRAQAALWLLGQMDDHMGFDRSDPAEVEREDWCRTICRDAIRESLDKAEQKIRAAVESPSTAEVA